MNESLTVVNDQFSVMNAGVSKYLDTIINLAIAYAPKLILAIIVYIVGSITIRVVLNTLNKILEKKKVDSTLHSFLRSFLRMGLKALLIIIVVSMLWVEMTSLIALLGAVGLAVGMSLSGTLQNFAGGIVLMVLRPFHVGDLINAQWHTGKVVDVTIFTTHILTADNRYIFIPNGDLANGVIINHTKTGKRRLDLVFGIGYDDDIDKARKVMLDLIKDDPMCHDDPAPTVIVSELADSSVNFTFRVWVDSKDYLFLKLKLNEDVKKAFDKHNISIPYPQRDVHIYNHDQK